MHKEFSRSCPIYLILKTYGINNIWAILLTLLKRSLFLCPVAWSEVPSSSHHAVAKQLWIGLVEETTHTHWCANIVTAEQGFCIFTVQLVDA